MNTAMLLGMTGGALITASFFPQVVKTIRLKKAKDLSLVTFIMICLNASLWLVYGIILKDLPLIIFNAIPLAVNLVIVSLKLKYK